jgi:hypothetical protein
MSADIELLSGNQFGQVKSGSLRLKGCLAPGWYNTEIQEWFSFQTSVLSSENIWSNLEFFWDRPKGRRMCWENLPDSHRSRVALYLLPIYKSNAIQGLVLRRAETSSIEFVRLGIFFARGEPFDELGTAYKFFDALPESMELDREVDYEGMVEYTITLV